MNKRLQLALPAFGPARNGERGLTLVEVLLAVGILAAVGATFVGAMATSSRATMIEHDQVTGEGLAKSQMEYIKRQDYRVDLQYNIITLSQNEIDAGYEIDISRSAPMNPRGDSTHNDDGLQKIIIDVKHSGETIFTLEDYKAFIGQ
jgi:type II secretory pathway pseudopilin PulG